jgi:hypothetical protein
MVEFRYRKLVDVRSCPYKKKEKESREKDSLISAMTSQHKCLIFCSSVEGSHILGSWSVLKVVGSSLFMMLPHINARRNKTLGARNEREPSTRTNNERIQSTKRTMQIGGKIFKSLSPVNTGLSTRATHNSVQHEDRICEHTCIAINFWLTHAQSTLIMTSMRSEQTDARHHDATFMSTFHTLIMACMGSTWTITTLHRPSAGLRRVDIRKLTWIEAVRHISPAYNESLLSLPQKKTRRRLDRPHTIIAKT